jgi:hypothetical protein
VLSFNKPFHLSSLSLGLLHNANMLTLHLWGYQYSADITIDQIIELFDDLRSRNFFIESLMITQSLFITCCSNAMGNNLDKSTMKHLFNACIVTQAKYASMNEILFVLVTLCSSPIKERIKFLVGALSDTFASNEDQVGKNVAIITTFTMVS